MMRQRTWMIAPATCFVGVGLFVAVFAGRLGISNATDPQPNAGPQSAADPAPTTNPPEAKQQTATFGAGCFWCTEAVFQQLKGVHSVVSGYSGGRIKNPTYQQICTGKTGHAEVTKITYDPAVISYRELLEVFWRTHDPTTLNRQGNDVGTQYRSVIFYHDEEQRQLAHQYKKALDDEGVFNRPIVTEISRAPVFYPAEDYHQNYFQSNPGQPYCRLVIVPKLEKFKQLFQEKMKTEPSD